MTTSLGLAFSTDTGLVEPAHSTPRLERRYKMATAARPNTAETTRSTDHVKAINCTDSSIGCGFRR